MNTNRFSARFYTVAALLMGVCLLAFTACGGLPGDAAPAGDGSRAGDGSSAASTAQQPDGALLEEADFDLYLDGAIAIDTPEVSFYDTQYYADDAPYVTQRGVGIGSSAEEVVEAYAGVYTELRLFDASGDWVETRQPADPLAADAAQWLDANAGAATFQLKFERIVLEGTAMTQKQFAKLTEDDSDEPEWENYTLYIDVTNGAVSNLGVTYLSNQVLDDAAAQAESRADDSGFAEGFF